MSDDSATPADRFASLAHETRLAIVRELGGPSPDGNGYVTLPFSVLQDRVGVEDNGKFAYHLGKLRGAFIERVDSGYRLARPGIEIYQAILAGSYADPVDLGPFETSISCVGDDCGGDLRCEHVNDRFRLWCPDCGEIIVHYMLVSGRFGSDLPDELLRAANRQIKRDQFSLKQGHCPYCGGSVEFSRLGMDGDFESAGSEHAFQHDCTRCNWYLRTCADRAAMVLPEVVASFAASGVELFEWAHWDDGVDREESIVSEDPLEILVRLTVDDVRREVLLDGNLEVLEVREPDASTEELPRT